MKINVEMDGSATGTKITDDAGNKIEDVCGISIEHQASGLPVAKVEMAAVVYARLQGLGAEFYIGGKQVKRIEYADGSSEDFVD